MLAAAPPVAAQAGTILLVRHAEKASATGDAPLSAAGIRRTAALVDALRAWPLDLIVTSQYRRSQETAAPVAAAQGVSPTVIRLEGDRAEDTRRIVARLTALPAGGTALVVGHSNTLMPLVAAWGGPTLPDLCDSRYDALFILQRSPGDTVARLVVARYGAPSDVDPACAEGR